MFLTHFECFRCGQVYPADHEGYVCDKDGGNLDAVYDYEAIARGLNFANPFGGERSDQFKYAPLLPLTSLEHAPPLRVGATPLYPVPRLAMLAGLSHVYLKDESANPSQSFKDRASAMVGARAKATGVQVVACASTGNAGSSMAAMAAAMHLPCVVFVPETAPPAKLAQLLIYGAHVFAVRGTYDDAFDVCVKVCEAKGWLNRNTGFNPYTREGKKTCSFEICEQFTALLGMSSGTSAPWRAPDRVVVPTGDGNIISGIWKGMRDLHAIGLIDRLPKIDCAQAEGSAAISRAIWALSGQTPAWKDVKIEPVHAQTVADSISVDDPRDGLAAVRAVLESGGTAVTVSDEEILAAIKDVARGSGIFVEPSCATVWAALRKMAEANEVTRDEQVVCLMTGSGLKDIQSARRVADEPMVIEPDCDKALKAVDSCNLPVDRGIKA